MAPAIEVELIQFLLRCTVNLVLIVSYRDYRGDTLIFLKDHISVSCATHIRVSLAHWVSNKPLLNLLNHFLSEFNGHPRMIITEISVHLWPNTSEYSLCWKAFARGFEFYLIFKIVHRQYLKLTGLLIKLKCYQLQYIIKWGESYLILR